MSLIVNFPKRPKLVFFIAFSLLGTTSEIIFKRKYFILEKNYTKSEQISRFHTKLQSSKTPRQKRKSKKSI